METPNVEPKAPETLLEAVAYFADESRAHAFLAALRWPEGKQACPKCGVLGAHYFLAKRRVYKCRDCRRQFSIKVGTVFEDSAIPLSKWLPALWMLANCKNGISSHELGRALGVTQKTAWFMLHRLRLAIQPDGGGKLDGTVEVDHSYIGGRSRNMHKSKRERVIKGRGATYMTGVLGMLERGRDGKFSRVRCKVGRQMPRREMLREIAAYVEDGATVNTDSDGSFHDLAERYAHAVVNHRGGEYVRGSVHTQGIENFWALLKRTVKGTYVNIAPFHTFRYLDEQAWRFNERDRDDGSRFRVAAASVGSKRLTYASLTGADLDRRSA